MAPPELAVLAARARPVTAASGRLLEVVPALAPLLPDGALRRGSTVAVAAAGSAGGALSLALALLAGPSAAGSWCAVVGLPELGAVAAAGAGAALERLALVPRPGEQWPVVTAALLEGADVVLARPAGRVRPGDARRLSARARERGAVLVVLDPPGPRAGSWPEGTDVRLAVTSARWSGLGAGHGHLRGREVEVVSSGRRAAARERRGRLWLPGPSGRPEPAGEAPAAGGVEVSRPAPARSGAAPVARAG